jgi:hypothetical protein
VRINEIHDGLLSFTASVRVRCGATPITVRTSLEADSQSQARALLCHLYGAANVLSVSANFRESPATNQVNRSSTFRDEHTQTSSKKPTKGPVHFSHVEEEGSATKVMSSDEQRVKAMSDQAKRLQQQAKHIRAQNAVNKAQTQMQNLSGKVH